eukprot:m.302725 g.302725  ORF g.302725 m.302725 type:complete len:428 (+) comp20151_c1_seq2:195-1478(+)
MVSPTIERMAVLAGGTAAAYLAWTIWTQFRHTRVAAPASPSQTGSDELDPASRKRESQNLLQLLYSIANDQAHKEGYVHRGVSCDGCGQKPLRGIRYKCMNCSDYDVCENCEEKDRHNRAHVFVKIRVPIPPLSNSRERLAQPLYPGFKQPFAVLPWRVLQRLQKVSHFDQSELEALHAQFQSLSTATGNAGGIELDTFNRCLGPLGSTKNLIAERLFLFFDRDGNGVIDFVEFVAGLSVLCKGSHDEKITYVFKGYDLGNKGYLTKNDLRLMFKAYFLLNMELVRDVVGALEREMIANFNDDGDRPVSALFTAPIPGHARAGEDMAEKPVTKPSNGGSRESTSFWQSWPGLTDDVDTAGAPAADYGGVMDRMSHDAIEELVTKAFAGVPTSGSTGDDVKMYFPDFRKWANADATVTAWFDSLGSVF